MELELEAAGSGGSKVVTLTVDSPTADLGRGDLGHGSPTRDRTISRCHVSLRLLAIGSGDPGVAFEIVGRNPVVVRRAPDGGVGSGSGVFRRGEQGELRARDSLSLKAPSFWAVRRMEGEMEPAVLDAVARRERKEREMQAVKEEAMELTEEGGEGEAGSEVEGLEIDLASVDPVREFGFLSMGHDFDSYPKGRIRPPKDWNWFLEEIKKGFDDEDDEVSTGRGRSRSRAGNKKKDGEGEDEDWTDECEDEKESLSKGPSVKRRKYITRSKDPKKSRKENSKVKSGYNNDEEEEDEGDETLGGFIANEEDDEAMEGLGKEEDEEEEFDDEEDDD